LTYRSLIIAVFGLCLVIGVPASGATVTVDIPSSAVTCDSTTFSVRINKIIDGQVSAHVVSNSTSPQSFVLKINGLQHGDQDWYVNGAYKGKKPDSEFAKGIALSLPGRVVSPDLFRCITSVEDRLSAEVERIKDNRESEHVRLINTLRQAQDWVNVTENTDKWARSMDVVVAPSDMALLVKSSSQIATSEKVQQVFVTSCHLFQQARDRMYDNIKDPDLRNEAVVSLTPVDLKFSYYIVNGKAKGTAVVVNYTNMPISGKVTPAVPTGWKVSAKALDFKNLASGKSCKVDFALVPPKTGGAPPASLRAQAAITLGYDPFWASFTLTAEVAKGATVQVPVVPKPEPKPAVGPAVAPAPVPAPPPGMNPSNGVRARE